jgi:hypothetical protein
MQMNGGVNVNDDAGLEKEADVMGARAIQFKPMDDMGFEGIDYAVMSLKAYDGWKDTIQAKMTINGTAIAGDQVVVTQFNNPANIAQMIKLGAKVKGGLLIAEGLLTLAAGTAGLFLSGGVGLVPGLLAIGVGVSKVIRGAITIYSDGKPKGKQLVVMDALRGLEAAAALATGIVTGHPGAIVYGVAKGLRALLTAVTDWMGEGTEFKTRRKILMGISAALHAVEVFAGMIGGIGALDKGDAASGADAGINYAIGGVALGVSVSKSYRATDQLERAGDAPTGSPAPPITETTSLLN